MTRLFCVMLVVLATLRASTLYAAAQPNVLFIICDDLNTHVSTSGYEHIQTPVLEQLAAEGMTFERAYCQYPVCGPSRASLLSGLYPESSGVISNGVDIRDLRPGTLSLPEAFRNAGYWTARVGKVFHKENTNPAEVWDENPERYRNDEMLIEAQAREQFIAHHGPINNGKQNTKFREWARTVSTQTRNQEGYGRSGLTDDQHKDGKNAITIIDHLENQAFGEKPFFIAMGVQKPHVPFLAPDKYFDMYPPDQLQYDITPADFWQTQSPRIAMNHRYRAFGFEFAQENEPLRREMAQAYHACITFIDAQIGRVIDTLKRTGQWDNTIIVFTSDNGYHIGQHNIWGKVTLFELCNRVPLLMRVPESVGKGVTTPGAISTGKVELVDLFPTLAELCGLEAPPHLQGKSLVPMLTDPTTAGKDVAYTVVVRRDDLGRAIRQANWRYSVYPDGSEELYDLDKDPREWTNLATAPEHEAVLKALRQTLADTQARASEHAASP